MDKNNWLTIEVVYATPLKQKLYTLRLPQAITIEEAIKKTEVLQDFTDLVLSEMKVGVFSKPRQLHDLVCDGDRIEIYRPLIIDPKEARRVKAKRRFGESLPIDPARKLK